MAISLLNSTTSYFGSEGVVHWIGHVVEDEEQLATYIRSEVRPRLEDDELPFKADVLALATTHMQTEFLEKFLDSSRLWPIWKLGEAFAECVLRDYPNFNAVWPWNLARDAKTPWASLPGADLVGFCTEENSAVFLFGEVKTSSENRSPPRVMSDMTQQLLRIIHRRDIKYSLLHWLYARCTSKTNLQLYQTAVRRYMESDGHDFRLIGVLVRDTQPIESDVKSTGKRLISHLHEPTKAELVAWYSPVKFSRWAKWIEVK